MRTLTFMFKLLPLLLVVLLSCKTTSTHEASASPTTTVSQREPDQTPTRPDMQQIDPSVDPIARAKANATTALERLPACLPGAAEGTLEIRATICTEMACKAACCNGCSFDATFANSTRFTTEQLTALLMSGTAPGKDCEVAAWREVFMNRLLGLVTDAKGTATGFCRPVPHTEKTPLERSRLVAVIEQLPACVPAKMQGYRFGALTFEAAMCTRMFCKSACCNGCSSRVQFTEKGQAPVTVTSESVIQLLARGDLAPTKDCDITAWADVLAGYEFGVAVPQGTQKALAGAPVQGLCLKGPTK